MSKIFFKFREKLKGLFIRDKPYNKTALVVIPILLFLLVAGVTVGILYFTDYNKSPVLTLSNIESGKVTETNEPKYDINGQINESRGAELFINSEKVEINSNGSFTYNAKLAEGNNDIEFKLIKNGKEIKTIYTIKRNVEKIEEAKVSEEVKEETKTTTPVVTPEAPKPIATSVEVSNNGCTFTFRAPAGYILTMGSIEPDNSNTMSMPEEGVIVNNVPGLDPFVGITVFGNIRETENGPILSSATSTINSICPSDI